MKNITFFILPVAVVAGLLFHSCDEKKTPKESKEEQKEQTEKAEGTSILKVGDKLFNLPSPLETAMLLEEVGGHFNESVLNPTVDASLYNTKEAQAMNLGVYGADLGYFLIYQQSQKAFKLLANCKKLGTELGISPALYSDLMKRFEGNMENRDSLLIFVSALNRLSDQYLKENENEDISAMILYGGWVESLYFVSQLTQSLENPSLRTRVGEQKNTLQNLIGLVDQENANGQFDDILADLADLEKSFNKVGTSYTWVEPETKPDQQVTVVKSQGSVTMDDALLNEIIDKVTALREKIITSAP
ncbi:MAG: hypothetical protein DCO99_12730 [Synechococcus sp. XM-24]|nr:MAG: hypothetical protein DCO99_12730 [Synechococcus sp. XM-24]